jgi:hypothetical protein
LTGARRGASLAFPIQLDELPDDELPDDDVEPEVVDPDEDDEEEDEPESRATAVPVVGASAGRARSCARAGAMLSANAVAATPIVNL